MPHQKWQVPLYPFKSANKVAAEEAGHINQKKNNKDFTGDGCDKKRALFGVIVFESDLNLAMAYCCYDERWVLELAFNRCKNNKCLDKAIIQEIFPSPVRSSSNFISTIITCRLLCQAKDAGLMDHMSYGDLMGDLGTA